MKGTTCCLPASAIMLRGKKFKFRNCNCGQTWGLLSWSAAKKMPWASLFNRKCHQVPSLHCFGSRFISQSHSLYMHSHPLRCSSGLLPSSTHPKPGGPTPSSCCHVDVLSTAFLILQGSLVTQWGGAWGCRDARDNGTHVPEQTGWSHQTSANRDTCSCQTLLAVSCTFLNG